MHKLLDRRAGVQLLMAFVLLADGAVAYAQVTETGWKPQKNVELVVGRQPGGAVDRLARLVEKISRERSILDVPLVLVHKAGGGGAIAWAYLQQHAGDGHYLLINSTELVTNRLSGRGTTNYTDVTVIAQLYDEYIALAVKADSPFKSAKELFMQLAKQPGALSISTGSSLGNTNHIAIALAAKASGIDPKKLKIVVFNSASQSVTALLGGHVDIVSVSLSNAVQHMRNGGLRILAIAAPRRLEEPLAHIPTYVEQGIDSVVVNWRVITAPPRLTAKQIGYWETVFDRIVKSAEWQQSMKRSFSVSSYRNSSDTTEYLRTESERFSRIFLDAGLAAKAPPAVAK